MNGKSIVIIFRSWLSAEVLHVLFRNQLSCTFIYLRSIQSTPQSSSLDKLSGLARLAHWGPSRELSIALVRVSAGTEMTNHCLRQRLRASPEALPAMGAAALQTDWSESSESLGSHKSRGFVASCSWSSRTKIFGLVNF